MPSIQAHFQINMIPRSFFSGLKDRISSDTLTSFHLYVTFCLIFKTDNINVETTTGYAALQMVKD